MSEPHTILEIDEPGLVALTTGRRARLAELSPEELDRHEAAWTAARDAAAALVMQRLGEVAPDDPLIQRLIEAGAVYMLSRRTDNVVSREQRDLRRDHFEFLLDQAARGRRAGDEDHAAAGTRTRPIRFPGAL